MIEWDRIGRPGFERIVNALLHRLYAEADTIEVINGRGGDGGRDVVVVQGRRLRIFQLKYFPEGFSASFGSRRKQIRRSFERAMEHSPYEWILVLPCELTPGEWDYVRQLGRGRNPRISVVDRPQLDGRVAAHHDLEASITRDQLVEKAAILNQEEAWLLSGPRDLDERVRNLAHVVDGVDDNWTVDFSRSGDAVYRRLRAKHPRAHEVSPITCELELNLGGDHHNLASAVERSFGFGTSENVTLPPDVVERWRLIGPQWLSECLEHVEVTWAPLPQVPKPDAPVRLQFFDREGSVVAAHEGVARHIGRGAQGYCLEADFCSATASLRFLFPCDQSRAGTLNARYQLARADPIIALRALRLYRELLTWDELEITVDGNRLGSLTFDQHRLLNQTQMTMLHDFEALVEDLDVVQRHCNVYFPVPETIDPADRVVLRAARLLIEGHCVAYPQARTLTVTLAGSDSEGIRRLLSGRTGVIRTEDSQYRISVGQHDLNLGRLSFFNSVIALDHEKANRALDEGRAEGYQVHLKPADGRNFRAYMPDKVTDPHQQLTPTPWGLPGVVEPK